MARHGLAVDQRGELSPVLGGCQDRARGGDWSGIREDAALRGIQLVVPWDRPDCIAQDWWGTEGDRKEQELAHCVRRDPGGQGLPWPGSSLGGRRLQTETELGPWNLFSLFSCLRWSGSV